MLAKSISVGAALALISIAGAAMGQSSGAPMPQDTETTVQGVGAACTGIGGARADLRWTAYPVRIEFSNARNEYMTDAAVTVKDAKGKVIVDAVCGGPWLLLKLAPGAYAVSAQLIDSPAKPRAARFRAPAKGQVRVVLQFPDA
jgi:hypothetical protein